MNHKSAILYGIGIWAFTFVVAMLIFPIWKTDRILFESIMPVALTLATTFASVRSFKNVKDRFVWIGLCFGIIWMISSLVLDGLAFSWGPMKMSLVNYIKDIGITYLLVLVIPLGFGYALSLKKGS